MPAKDAMVEQVASQMMKCGRPGRLMASDRQRENFKQRHEKHILWAVEHLPRSSAAVAAVVVKCLIRYDGQRVAKFCKALRHGLFDGTNDPAHLLWKYLQKQQARKETIDVYQRAVCAAKAYMEGRSLMTVRPVREDVFNWDEGYTVPDELLANWNPDVVPGEDPVETPTAQVVGEVMECTA